MPALLVSSILGCSLQTQIYTSKDLALLPCEQREKFFFPLEFNEAGTLVYEDQMVDLKQRLQLQGKPVKDVYIFIHGWNKTTEVAESEYQDFICRFYTRNDHKNDSVALDDIDKKHTIVVGVFWPSTLFPNTRDPVVLKPVSYFPIRNRADVLAATGFQHLLKLIQEFLGTDSQRGKFRFHLIGHSFGGRIVAKGLMEFLADPTSNGHTLFDAIEKLNLIMLLPAISSDALDRRDLLTDFEKVAASLRKLDYPEFDLSLNSQEGRRTIAKFVLDSENESEESPSTIQVNSKSPGEIHSLANAKSLSELGQVYAPLHIVVVHSSNDSANGLLYPIASLFTSDRASCGLGACGAPNIPSTVADDSGNIKNPAILKTNHIANVDASAIIFSHTDIFKGRVAHLIWQIITHIQNFPEP
jgi:pimeloyl-ACP methyl ester carboxylesterase